MEKNQPPKTSQPSFSLGSFSFRGAPLIAAITLLGFALRLVRLDSQPLWWDEGYSIFFATRPLGELTARTALDIHPPLYYILLQFWLNVFGVSDVSARLFSVVIGTASIAMLYALARQLAGDARIAAIGALLFALAPFHVYYSQEVRMYGLVTLLGLASVYFFVRLCRRCKTGWKVAALPSDAQRGWATTPQNQIAEVLDAVLYILCTTAALYTQYFAAFLIAFQVLYILVGWQDSRAVRDLAVGNRAFPVPSRPTSAQSQPTQVGSAMTRSGFNRRMIFMWLATFALYLPWLIYAGSKLYAYVTGKVAIESYAPLDPLTFLWQHLAAFSVGHLSEFTWLSAFAIGFLALAIIGLVSRFSLSPSLPRPRAPSLPRPRAPAPPRPRAPALPPSPAPALPRSLSPLLSLYLLTPLALGYLVNLRYSFHPIRYERLLLFAAPAFYLLAARGIAALWSHRAAFGAMVVAAIGIVGAIGLYDFYSVPRYAKDDYRPLIAELQSFAQDDDNLLAIYPWQIGYLQAYYNGARLNVIEAPSDAWIVSTVKMQSDVDALLQKNPRVWIPALQTQGRILEDALDAYLRARAYSITDTWFGTTRLELFARQDDPPRANNPLAFDDLQIANWGVSREPITAGDNSVRVWFDWGYSPPSGVNLSLRLLDRNGKLWAQDDREASSGIQRVGLAIPAGTPRGEYALRLTLYRARDGKPLQPNGVLLATLQVTAPQTPNLNAITHRVTADFANGMRLLGYHAANDALQPGKPAPIVLYWTTARALDAEYSVVMQIKDLLGKTVSESRTNIAQGAYPPSAWRAGELVRDPQTLSVFGDAGDGAYQISIALESRDGASVKTTDARDRIALGTLEVKSRPHYFGAPAVTYRAEYRWEDVARLVGYDVVNTRVVLYWQALGSPRVAYQGFVHLYNANDKRVAQRDQIFGAGAYPTTSWVKGEYLVDVYDLALPADAWGVYTIRIGMYNPDTGARLRAFDTANQFVGDIVELPTRIKSE